MESFLVATVKELHDKELKENMLFTRLWWDSSILCVQKNLPPTDIL